MKRRNDCFLSYHSAAPVLVEHSSYEELVESVSKKWKRDKEIVDGNILFTDGTAINEQNYSKLLDKKQIRLFDPTIKDKSTSNHGFGPVFFDGRWNIQLRDDATEYNVSILNTPDGFDKQSRFGQIQYYPRSCFREVLHNHPESIKIQSGPFSDHLRSNGFLAVATWKNTEICFDAESNSDEIHGYCLEEGHFREHSIKEYNWFTQAHEGFGRKIPLVFDLDDTLIRAVTREGLPDNSQQVPWRHKDLYGHRLHSLPDSLGMVVLAEGVYSFLESFSKKYVFYVCSLGSHDYVQAVVSLLNKNGVYIKPQRAHSMRWRHDKESVLDQNGRHKYRSPPKDLKHVVPSTVVMDKNCNLPLILDDNRGVWVQNENVITVTIDYGQQWHWFSDDEGQRWWFKEGDTITKYTVPQTLWQPILGDIDKTLNEIYSEYRTSNYQKSPLQIWKEMKANYLGAMNIERKRSPSPERRH
eukprot:TRINITY_DN11887_c0_g1_i1.p1 TRINITY_DN11887_c0_g1~~TRINITY_DN11887_c0_g1_i1.p1  ORF type:complete len:477 (-),score=37.55 TRINITY_DN11887_c0_g1_i1:27-1433(-)